MTIALRSRSFLSKHSNHLALHLRGGAQDAAVRPSPQHLCTVRYFSAEVKISNIIGGRELESNLPNDNNLLKMNGSNTVQVPEDNISGIEDHHAHDHSHDHGHSHDDVDEEEDDYTEEMFVHPDASLGSNAKFVGREWGGPRRGGRFEEPTRFGDWERKGRCTDF